MNKIITADYFPGKACQCEARSSYECGCDVDWTPVEVYKLREDAKQLADRLTALERERDEAREALERISHASMSVRHKEEDYVEWEKAVESLLGICEENNFTNE